jgi:hypothetical protein
MKETIVDIANVAKVTGEIRKNNLKLIKTCTLEIII